MGARSRLQLHFSGNLVDWSLAGILLSPKEPGESHFDYSMAVSGKDLCLISSTREASGKARHDADAVTFHTLPDFRELAY